jgi:hypothetical protein
MLILRRRYHGKNETTETKRNPKDVSDPLGSGDDGKGKKSNLPHPSNITP